MTSGTLLLSAEQVAGYIGMSVRTVYTYMNNGTLPITWDGAKRRVSLDDCDDFVARVQATGRSARINPESESA